MLASCPFALVETSPPGVAGAAHAKVHAWFRAPAQFRDATRAQLKRMVAFGSRKTQKKDKGK